MVVLVESNEEWGLGRVVRRFLVCVAELTSGLSALALHPGLVGLLPSSTLASPNLHPALVLAPNPRGQQQLAIHQVH